MGYDKNLELHLSSNTLKGQAKTCPLLHYSTPKLSETMLQIESGSLSFVQKDAPAKSYLFINDNFAFIDSSSSAQIL